MAKTKNTYTIFILIIKVIFKFISMVKSLKLKLGLMYFYLNFIFSKIHFSSIIMTMLVIGTELKMKLLCQALYFD